MIRIIRRRVRALRWTVSPSTSRRRLKNYLSRHCRKSRILKLLMSFSRISFLASLSIFSCRGEDTYFTARLSACIQLMKQVCGRTSPHEVISVPSSHPIQVSVFVYVCFARGVMQHFLTKLLSPYRLLINMKVCHTSNIQTHI